MALAPAGVRRDPEAMAEIVNLNRARKARDKAVAGFVASANRVLHGLTKAEKTAARAERDRADRLIDGHKRDEGGDGGPK